MMTGNAPWKSETNIKNNTVLTNYSWLHLTCYYNINYVIVRIIMRNCLALPLVPMLHKGVALENVGPATYLKLSVLHYILYPVSLAALYF